MQLLKKKTLMSVPLRDHRPKRFYEMIHLQTKRSIVQELVWDTTMIAISFVRGTNIWPVTSQENSSKQSNFGWLYSIKLF